MGFKPDVSGRGAFVRILSTKWLFPLIIGSGAVLSFGVFFNRTGMHELSVLCFILSVPLIILLAIPGAICYIQQIDRNKVD